MLDVKKRAGGNIINAIDQLKVIVEDLQQSFPRDMSITYTNDQSVMIRSQISNLENSIVFGVILVVFVLQAATWGFKNPRKSWLYTVFQ